MSDVAPDARLEVGSILFEALRMASRRWYLVLVGVVGLGCLNLLLLAVDSRCRVEHGACIFDHFDTVLGSHAPVFLRDIMRLAYSGVAFVVLTLISVAFYAQDERAFVAPLDRGAFYSRWPRFVRRAMLVWIITVGPQFILNRVHEHLQLVLAPDQQASNVLDWADLIFVALTVLTAIYLHARLVLYLPSAVYAPEPEGFGSAWSRTSQDWRRLFGVFVLVSAAWFVLSIVGAYASDWLDLAGLVQHLAAWSGSNEFITSPDLSAVMANTLSGVVIDLLDVAVCIAAYRRLILIDHLRAPIFD